MTTIKKKHEQYADAAFEKLEKLQEMMDFFRAAIDFGRTWDDENVMFWAFVMSKADNYNIILQAARANIERLSELADPDAPQDLPF